MESNQICGTCKFFFRESYRDKKGQCRRSPPTVFYAGYDPAFIFPEMSIADWCGEYQEDKEVMDALKKLKAKRN